MFGIKSNKNKEKSATLSQNQSRLKITETVLRDGQQSLAATRMTTDDMLPILETMDKVGYHSLECWGGATYDTCIRFLQEDPWDRLRKIRSIVKNTKLQMLLRGQNLLGYRHYSDDVVTFFVQKAIANGIDIIRAFDAFNDLRNLETTVNAVKKEGGEVQIAISYTLGDGYTLDYWKELAKQMESMGADSIAIKDMSGLLLPDDAGELVKALKSTVKVPIQLHTHCTTGIAMLSYMKAIEAGVDIVDTAISPFAEGSSQPATEVLAKVLEGTARDPGFDQEVLAKIADHFKPIRDRFLSEGILDPKVMGVDVKGLQYQVPGGMLSNLISQLKMQNAMDKFEDVLKEIPKVREDLGQPPLVTPSSQIVGTQALLNILSGNRYQMMATECKEVLRGKYGKTIKPFNKDLQKQVLGDTEPITCRPADLLEPELDKLKTESAQYSIQEEDVLTYALFPHVAVDFFTKRAAGGM